MATPEIRFNAKVFDSNEAFYHMMAGVHLDSTLQVYTVVGRR
jgi:hypothetical protein